MEAPKKAEKTLALGDVATFEVVTPHCGLKAGYRRRMTVTRELQECIAKGLWKFKK